MSPSFEESCVRFRQFLVENGYSHGPAWTTREDVLLGRRRKLYARFPIPNRNREHARSLFEAAMNEQTGVSFSAVCETDRTTLCRVWVPADDTERKYAM